MIGIEEKIEVAIMGKEGEDEKGVGLMKVKCNRGTRRRDRYENGNIRKGMHV